MASGSGTVIVCELTPNQRTMGVSSPQRFKMSKNIVLYGAGWRNGGKNKKVLENRDQRRPGETWRTHTKPAKRHA